MIEILPKIIKANEKDKEKVKSVLKLGFSNDDLLRWVFPSADSFLQSFDIWMEEFSKESFKNNIVFSEENFSKNYLMESYLEYHLRAIVTKKGLKILNNYIENNNPKNE